MSEQPWWRGAVIYQIYPRSFKDSNGDGIGDLAGITQQLDYVAELGVDAVWIAPFFKSPMDDFGYDVSDYRAVDPMFGTLEDFDLLIARAHGLGLKVMIDQVLSHTSNQHAWFEESRRDRSNARADWYVWADPKPDGSPPNNWLSIFGGAAWQWEPRRQQYYLHNFLPSQPDLNFHNPTVRQHVLEEAEFWLKRGVDGFRLDTVNFYYHDPELRNNPARPEDKRVGQGFSADNPYAYQYHRYDKSQPENAEFMRDVRALLDRYGTTAAVGEIGADDGLSVMSQYTAGDDKLHMAYSFELLSDKFSAEHIRTTVEALEDQIGDGWPCWSLNNHDVKRVMTRWGGEHPAPELAKVLMAMLLSLRGSVCLYQGEELGLPQADVPFEQLQDPFGKAFWPEFKGRDGCRTPMPWVAEGIAAGFSEERSWLPVPEPHRALAVAAQHKLPGSVLNAYRTFLRWRRQYPTLRCGEIEFIDAPTDVLAFTRSYAEEQLLLCFNLSASTANLMAPENWQIEPLTHHGFAGSFQDHRIDLPAYEAFFGRIII